MYSIISRILEPNGMRADSKLRPQGLLGPPEYIGIMACLKAFPGRAFRTSQ